MTTIDQLTASRKRALLQQDVADFSTPPTEGHGVIRAVLILMIGGIFGGCLVAWLTSCGPESASALTVNQTEYRYCHRPVLNNYRTYKKYHQVKRHVEKEPDYLIEMMAK